MDSWGILFNSIICSNDKSKVILGIPEDKLDTVEAWLREIANDLIEPPLDCVILKQSLVLRDGSERVIIRVNVPRSLFVHRSPGGYFQRIGSSKRQMKPVVQPLVCKFVRV